MADFWLVIIFLERNMFNLIFLQVFEERHWVLKMCVRDLQILLVSCTWRSKTSAMPSNSLNELNSCWKAHSELNVDPEEQLGCSSNAINSRIRLSLVWRWLLQETLWCIPPTSSWTLLTMLYFLQLYFEVLFELSSLK